MSAADVDNTWALHVEVWDDGDRLDTLPVGSEAGMTLAEAAGLRADLEAWWADNGGIDAGLRLQITPRFARSFDEACDELAAVIAAWGGDDQ